MLPIKGFHQLSRSLLLLQVAQLLTVKRERELADNIGKRESRSKQQ